MQRLTQLVQAAVGYSPSRGDVVTVEQMPFDLTSTVPPLSLLDHIEQWIQIASPLLRPAALVLGVVLLVLLVFRPMLKAAASAPVGRALAAGGSAQGVVTETAAEALAKLPPLERQKLQAQLVFERVGESINREPAQSARLLQSWIHSNE